MVMGAAAGEETVFDPSIARSRHLPAKDTDSRFPVGMLAGVAAIVIVVALGVWAWSSGFLGGGPAEPVEPVGVEITLNLNIQAPPDLAIWVDGEDSGFVTPQALPLSGLVGDFVVVELRYNGEALASQTVSLASDTADTWIPERIDEIVAEAVRGAAAVAAPGDEPIAEEPPAPVLFTIASSPAGAMVSFDDNPLGASPVQVEVDLSVGHSLRIEADGYDPLSWSFSGETLTDDQRASQEFFFPLTSSVPPGFFVVDNQQYGYPVAVDRGTERQYQRKNAHVRGLLIAQYPTATRQLPNQAVGARHLLGGCKAREHRLRRARECGSAATAERANCCQSRQLCDQHRRPRGRILASHAAAGIGPGI